MEDHKFLRDVTGSVLVESTIVVPILLLLVLGTIDATYLFFEWSLANKAAYVGARAAAVSNPVAPNIVNITYTSAQLNNIGQSCISVSCPSANATCTSTTCTTTTTGFTPGFDSTAFTNSKKTGIFDKMQAIFPRLQPQNVMISYQTNGSGVVGEPYSGNASQFSLPMNVTVQITCMTHQFYFLSGLMGWVFTPPTGCSPAPLAGPPISASTTTMQSEDMYTN